MPRLLFADSRGVVYDHPRLLAAARSGERILRPRERPVALPAGGAVAVTAGGTLIFDPARANGAPVAPGGLVAVPEPGTMGLAAAGAIAALVVSWKRRRRNAGHETS